MAARVQAYNIESDDLTFFFKCLTDFQKGGGSQFDWFFFVFFFRVDGNSLTLLWRWAANWTASEVASSKSRSVLLATLGRISGGAIPASFLTLFSEVGVRHPVTVRTVSLSTTSTCLAFIYFFVCLCYLISSPIVNLFWWFFCIGFNIVSNWSPINFIDIGPFLLCMFTCTHVRNSKPKLDIG